MNGVCVSLMVATVLGGGGLRGEGADVSWHEDYGVALREAREARRPLLIVLASPEQVSQPFGHARYRPNAGEPNLLSHYELCHIDVTTDYGKRVAAAFKTTEFPYTAITDKAGQVLIYRNVGRVGDQQWNATLAAYRHGEAVVEPPPRSRICFT